MSDPASEVSVKRLPRLGGLVLLAGLLGLVAAALAVAVPYYSQMALIERVEGLGGFIDSTPGGPAWLRSLLGSERMRGFDTIEGLDFHGPSITDSDLTMLSAVPKLKYLLLTHTKITDTGLESLAGLSELKILSLWGTPITDAGLSHLANLPSLEHLGLQGTDVTDDGLLHLAELPQLQWIGLDSTSTTALGVERLKAQIPHCSITTSE